MYTKTLLFSSLFALSSFSQADAADLFQQTYDQGTRLFDQMKYEQALSYYDEAFSLLAESDRSDAEKNILRRDIHAAMSIAYLRTNRPDEAARVLTPYVKADNLTAGMKANYLSALRQTSRFTDVIHFAKTFWSSIDNTPSFALRSLAESLVQLGQYQEAQKVYYTILQRNATDENAQLGLAFCQINQGETEQGLKSYEKTLLQNPKNLVIVLQDGDSFYRQDRFLAGQAVYDLAKKLFPEKKQIHLKQGQIYLELYQPRAAFKAFQLALQDPTTKLEAQIGLTQASLLAGDYEQARLSTEPLQNTKDRSLLATSAINSYHTKPKGTFYVSSDFTSSHKKLETFDFNINTSQLLSDHVWLNSSQSSSRLWDRGMNQSASVQSQQLGLKYIDLNQNLSGHWDLVNHGNQNGYALAYSRYLSDQASFTLSTHQAPLLDVQALSDALTEKSDAFTWHQDLGLNEVIAATVGRGSISDGNSYHFYSLQHHQTLARQAAREVWRTDFWSRTNWSEQGKVYESPSTRESYGTTWTIRQNVNQGYWQTDFTLGQEHDAPDPWDFLSTARLERYWQFDKLHSLAVYGQYGLHTDRTNNSGGLHYSERQYGMNYAVQW